MSKEKHKKILLPSFLSTNMAFSALSFLVSSYHIKKEFMQKVERQRFYLFSLKASKSGIIIINFAPSDQTTTHVSHIIFIHVCSLSTVKSECWKESKRKTCEDGTCHKRYCNGTVKNTARIKKNITKLIFIIVVVINLIVEKEKWK